MLNRPREECEIDRQGVVKNKEKIEINQKRVQNYQVQREIDR